MYFLAQTIKFAECRMFWFVSQMPGNAWKVYVVIHNYLGSLNQNLWDDIRKLHFISKNHTMVNSYHSAAI